jgi:hypothetical protein
MKTLTLSLCAFVRRLVVLGLARRAAEALPDPLRPVLEAVDLRVKPAVDAEDLARGARPDLRGYYYAEQDESAEGTCEDLLRCDRDTWGARRPEIVLIAGNIAPTLEAVAEVLMHELGHHLGFSECELVDGLGLI